MIRDSDSTETLGSDSPDSRAEPTREELFALLERPLRRRVLRDLDPGSGPVRLADLAEQVADGRDPDEVAAALHHNHLPRLADHGLVEYDYRNNLVVPADRDGFGSYVERFEG